MSIDFANQTLESTTSITSATSTEVFPHRTCASNAASAEDGLDPALDVEAVIRRVHEGELSASDLPLEVRHQCVAHLGMQGFTSVDIAAVMQMNARTVRRDRAAIRKGDAILPDMHLGDELLGEYQRYLHAGIQRLTRRVNDRSEPAYVRLWAEEAITRMYRRFIETVRKLNYLRDGESRLRHQVATDPSEQKHEIERYEAGVKLAAAKDPIPTMHLQKGVLEMLKNLGIGKQKERETNTKHPANPTSPT